MNQARTSDAQLRLVPNESVWASHETAEIVELVSDLIDAGRTLAATVELDPSDRTRPNEERGGASPIEVVELLIGGAVGIAVRELLRFADLSFDVLVAWVRRHQRPPTDPTIIRILGPKGETLREVMVDEEGKERPWPPT